MEPVGVSSEQLQPPLPELKEAANQLRQSFDGFLQQAGVDQNTAAAHGMKSTIKLEPTNNSGQKHLKLGPDNPLLEFGQEVFGKPVLVQSVEVSQDLGILIRYASLNPSSLEKQQKVILTGESKITRETTLVIHPQQGSFLYADISFLH